MDLKVLTVGGCGRFGGRGGQGAGSAGALVEGLFQTDLSVLTAPCFGANRQRRAMEWSGADPFDVNTLRRNRSQRRCITRAGAWM